MNSLPELPVVPSLVITARPDPDTHALFSALRQRHFPPARTVVPAHISLFHQLPGDELARLGEWLAVRLAGQAPFAARTSGVRFLGRGVALAIECEPLQDVNAAMAREWDSVLIPQDRQPFRPHVTIQNKAEPAAARALYDQMLADFQPLAFTITGVQLWWYLGGPWAEAAVIACKA